MVLWYTPHAFVGEDAHGRSPDKVHAARAGLPVTGPLLLEAGLRIAAACLTSREPKTAPALQAALLPEGRHQRGAVARQVAAVLVQIHGPLAQVGRRKVAGGNEGGGAAFPAARWVRRQPLQVRRYGVR